MLLRAGRLRLFKRISVFFELFHLSPHLFSTAPPLPSCSPFNFAASHLSTPNLHTIPHPPTSLPPGRNVLEDCLASGRPLLIENVEEELDPVLDPVLERRYMRKGGCTARCCTAGWVSSLYGQSRGCACRVDAWADMFLNS